MNTKVNPLDELEPRACAIAYDVWSDLNAKLDLRLFPECPIPFKKETPEELQPVPRYAGMFDWNECAWNLTINIWKRKPEMKHTREDYADAAREMYEDDPAVHSNFGPSDVSRGPDGAFVKAYILVINEEVERRKGPFSTASRHDGAIVMRRDLERSYILHTYARVEFPRSGPDYVEVRLEQAQKIADALNAQWRAEKEES